MRAIVLSCRLGHVASIHYDKTLGREHTSGAGAPGNAVLFGHVSWKGLPGVFKNLHQRKRGDKVEIVSPAQGYRYRVVSV